MNCLGLDYGQKYLGVAIASGPLATPLTTITTTKALEILPRLIETHQVKVIVIGLPEGPVHVAAEKFIKDLKTVHPEVQIVDETLTTHDAIKNLLHTTPTRRKVKEHSVAAALILQSWLDSSH